jgi:hypothetical protein
MRFRIAASKIEPRNALFMYTTDTSSGMGYVVTSALTSSMLSHRSRARHASTLLRAIDVRRSDNSTPMTRPKG